MCKVKNYLTYYISPFRYFRLCDSGNFSMALFRLKLITDRPEEILPFLNIRLGFKPFGGKTVDDA